jgi:drug/metabolite transporter (DMT)-like permease
VLLRRVWPLDRADHILAVALVAAGALAWATGWVLARRATHPVDGREAAELAPATIRALSLGTLALAIAGFVLGVLPPPST